jgi:hypothetical protein
MNFMIAAAILAAPTAVDAPDPDAVCAMALIDTAAYAKDRPGLSAQFRASLTEGAEFFSGVLIGRHEDAQLPDVLSTAVKTLVADQKRQELVTGCLARRDQARGRLRAAAQRGRENMLGSGKDSKQPR